MPQFEFHSEEAQQILGKLPSWIIRWGITLIFIIFGGIIIACYFIKYPQTVDATVVITTINPPADLMARSTGRIDKLFKADGEGVFANEPVALLYSTANYNSLLSTYDSLIKSNHCSISELVFSTWLEPYPELGEVQPYYSDFLRVCAEYRHYLESANIEKKKKLISDQIVKNREYYEYLVSQKNAQEIDVEIEKVNLQRDSLLHSKSLISAYDFSQSQRSFLQTTSSLDNMKGSLINAELVILQQEQQLVELTMQEENDVSTYETSILNSRQNLIAQLEQWIYQYLLVSPVEGKVVYTNYWSTNQTVQMGERVATVVPNGEYKIIGRLTVPTYGFGKVLIGQYVNVKLNGYPYMEYGQLRGIIRSISEVPEEDGYIAEIEFPDGFVSTYGKELGVIQQMNGSAQIITHNQRLLERFLQPLRALFDKGV